MRVLLLTSHSIAEFDDLRMLTDIGYDVFSVGAYTYPPSPSDDKRPGLKIRYHADLKASCDNQRAAMSDLWGDPGPKIDWAKAVLADDVLDWAEVIIVHHFPEHWIHGAWERIKTKRVIWRTCGQSSPDGSLERLMAPLRAEGLQIVRYSPNEAVLPDYAGHDAIIRFGKYPADYGPWTGADAVIGNVTQHMAQRGDACGYGPWMELTAGLPTAPAGPGSEVLPGGVGPLPYPLMVEYLTRIRAYLYTGTHPASYTLGLMEAMLSGAPVIAPPWDTSDDVLNRLFEAPALLPRNPAREAIPAYLHSILYDQSMAARHGQECRQAAIDLFDVAHIGPQWKAFLG